MQNISLDITFLRVWISIIYVYSFCLNFFYSSSSSFSFYVGKKMRKNMNGTKSSAKKNKRCLQ